MPDMTDFMRSLAARSLESQKRDAEKANGPPDYTGEDGLHNYFIVNGKTRHCGWCRAWQLGLARQYIERGAIYVAVKLTNGEYHSRKSDDDIKSMLGTDLCDSYCPLPDHLKGVHCYGGEPVMCEGSHCKEAIEAWKEEEVDE